MERSGVVAAQDMLPPLVFAIAKEIVESLHGHILVKSYIALSALALRVDRA